MISAESLLAISDREVQKVDIKGGSVFVRSISAGEQVDLEALQTAAGNDVRKILTAQIGAYVSDEQGARVFTEEQALQFVDRRRSESLKKIVQAALKLNGWSKAGREEVKGNS